MINAFMMVYGLIATIAVVVLLEERAYRKQRRSNHHQ